MEKKKKNPIISYFKDVKKESKKIVWPSRKNLIKYSVATLIFIAFMALFFLILSFLTAFLQGTVMPWIRTIIK